MFSPFVFLKLSHESAKKSNFMLTTIRKPLLRRQRLDTRLKRQSRKQRFSLVVQKGNLRQFPELDFLFFCLFSKAQSFVKVNLALLIICNNFVVNSSYLWFQFLLPILLGLALGSISLEFLAHKSIKNGGTCNRKVSTTCSSFFL